MLPVEPLAQLRGVYSRQRFERILSFIGSQLGYTAEEVLETFEWLGMTFTPDERIRVAETGVEKRLELICAHNFRYNVPTRSPCFLP